MDTVRLGKTDIVTNKNGFGVLPLQRTPLDEAVAILRRAYEGGITYFDTARMYTDSEEKIGVAFRERFASARASIFIATKTMAKTAEDFWSDLETSLANLGCGSIDVYQFHNPPFVPRPGGADGLYDAMLEARSQGKVRHIGITNHRILVAEEAIDSGLFSTLQYPFSYLSDPRETALAQRCAQAEMGFVAMKSLAGGLIGDPALAYAYANQFANVLPIWGIQRMSELEEFLSYQEQTPQLDAHANARIEADRADLAGEFCRSCGYCLPCSADIDIPTCARMALMLRRSPTHLWLDEVNQAKMARIPECTHCNHCLEHCPYGLDVPDLLQRNYEDYQTFL